MDHKYTFTPCFSFTPSTLPPNMQGRTAEPRIPRFAWERMPDAADTQPMDEGCGCLIFVLPTPALA